MGSPEALHVPSGTANCLRTSTTSITWSSPHNDGCTCRWYHSDPLTASWIVTRAPSFLLKCRSFEHTYIPLRQTYRISTTICVEYHYKHEPIVAFILIPSYSPWSVLLTSTKRCNLANPCWHMLNYCVWLTSFELMHIMHYCALDLHLRSRQ